ncbi:MAG TPA: XrtA system polysaccharide chain length determinant [Candidatus Binatia bacterium]|nr:XrtA system polysaccharide chain length determinant [Candidatus Binatia bacterium]
MNGVADFDLSQILSSFSRRKGLIFCVFLVVFLLSVYTALILPNVYQSSSLILVSPQRVPSSFVASTVTTDLADRMQSIVQEILSRTQLEKVVEEFSLYPSKGGGTPEDRVERLRKAIKVEFRRNNVFQLSYESNDPEKAKQVTGRIASLFIEQNLQVRQQQAIGTKSFITAEAERLRKELEEQETVVNQYKAAHRFELPDQLDSNLRTLEQLRRELEATNQRLAAVQERRGILQKQAVESDILGVDLLGGVLTGPAEGGAQNVQLQMKKKELETLLQRYSDKHPDVVRVKKEIDALQAESREKVSSKPAAGSSASGLNPLKQVLQSQISDIDAEMQTLRSQRDHIRSQIGGLQARVEATPIRAIELSKISRGYEITLRKYQDLLAKSLESELSENMEKKQKGEQFQILDPANFPLKPIRPNRPLIILIGFLGGLAAGFGLAFLWDNLDTSFKRSDEVSSYVNVPLLATMPALMTRGTILEQRRAQGIMVLASVGALAVGIVCVRMFGPMYF